MRVYTETKRLGFRASGVQTWEEGVGVGVGVYGCMGVGLLNPKSAAVCPPLAPLRVVCPTGLFVPGPVWPVQATPDLFSSPSSQTH